MKRTVFFVFFTLSLSEIYPQNLAVNPGMESWDSPTKPTGWSLTQGCAMETSLRTSGIYSCIQTGGSTSSNDLNQSIPIQPGKDYSFSVYYQTGATSTGNGGRIWCKWLNSGVDVTDEASKAIMQTGYLQSPAWQQYSFTVKAPATATTFLLQVRTLSNSISYWDDFVFEESVATGIIDDSRASPMLYPVPADNYLFIKNASGIKSLEILDLSGTPIKVLNTTAESELSIAIGDLTKGFYVLRMKYDGSVETRKFIKE